MVGHGGDRRLRRRRPTCARSPCTCCASAPHESCGKCFPCRIGLRRAHDDVRRRRAGRPRSASSSCSRRSSSAACAPTAAACRRRSAACSPTSPTSWGSRDARSRSTAPRSRSREGTTILEAAARPARAVPTLCFDERQAPFGACRVCLVGVEGAPRAAARLHDAVPRRDGDRHPRRDRAPRRHGASSSSCSPSCPSRPRRTPSSPQVARQLERRREPRWPGRDARVDHDDRHPYLAFQHELCISCGRCVRACDEVQGAFALTATGRGFDANVTAGLDAGFRDSTCVSCGACADTCPTDAITEITLLDAGDRERPSTVSRR